MAHENLPKTVELGGNPYNFRLMTADDRDAILNFAQTLSEADLWFMRRDITQPMAVDEWINDITHDKATSILVEHDEQIIAYGSIYYNQLFWNRHIAEMRVMVSAGHRGRGMGQKIARELTLIAKEMGMDKVIVYMAASDQSARRMVDYLDFKPEAILSDWIKGRDERTHDLLIMSTDLSETNS
jgi:RimJ/RimL family protein N-acetyltransferase